MREPIVTLDDEARRLVWTAEGGRARHYNAALQVSSLPDGVTSVVWTADFLPDDIGAISRRRSKREWRRCSARWTRSRLEKDASRACDSLRRAFASGAIDAYREGARHRLKLADYDPGDEEYDPDVPVVVFGLVLSVAPAWAGDFSAEVDFVTRAANSNVFAVAELRLAVDRTARPH